MKTQGNFILFDSREEFKTWLDKQVITRTIKLIQNHHTAAPSYANFNGKNHFEKLEGMRNFHVNTRGFSGTAQQLTTFTDGSIGYSLDRTFNTAPAGITGVNANGICIEHLGYFDLGGDVMSEEHKKTILFVNAALVEKCKLSVDTEHIVYHAWYDSDGNKVYNFTNGSPTGKRSVKSCPGTAFFGGNTVIAAQKYFIPLIKVEYAKLINKASETDSTPNTSPTAPQPADDIKIVANNVLVSLGRLIEGLVYTPLRKISESLGSSFLWDNNKKIAYVNEIALPEAKIIDGSAYVSIRNVGEILKYTTIKYDAATKKVYLYK